MCQQNLLDTEWKSKCMNQQWIYIMNKYLFNWNIETLAYGLKI